MRNLILDLSKPFRKVAFDKVASPEALGFIIGGAVAQKLGKGFIPIRKGGALPTRRRHIARVSFVDYTSNKKSLEINRSLVSIGDRILIVDDMVETGAQVKAVIKLIERSGGKVIGISVLGAEKNRKTKILFDRYSFHAIDS
jgi:adenine phosphoribosyltransferase